MTMQDLRQLSDEDLRKEVEESYREMRNLRFRLSTRQLTNVHEESKVKKRIARMKTLQRQRQLGIGQ